MPARSTRARALTAGMAAGLLSLLLAGCASSVPTRVTTFHQLPATVSGAGPRFAVVPGPDQRDSLEFASHAERLTDALTRQGWVAVADSQADYRVSLQQATSPVQGSWGGGGGPGGVSVGISGGGFSLGGVGIGVGFGVPIGGGRPVTTYRHQLSVQIERQRPPGRVYEGTAVAESESESALALMPALIQALFDRFPGESGSTRTVEVQPPASR